MVVFIRPICNLFVQCRDRSPQCSTSGSPHLGSHSRFSMRESRFAWRYSTWRFGASVGDLAATRRSWGNKDLRKTYGKTYGKAMETPMENRWKTDGKPVGNLWKNRWKTCRKSMRENRWKTDGKNMEVLAVAFPWTPGLEPSSAASRPGFVFLFQVQLCLASSF